MDNLNSLNNILKLYGKKELFSLNELKNIPLMTKQDLRQWSFETCLLAPKYIQMSSGTTGTSSLVYVDEKGKEAIIKRYVEIFKIFGLSGVFLNHFSYSFGQAGIDVEYASKFFNCTLLPLGNDFEKTWLDLAFIKGLNPKMAILTTETAFNILNKLKLNSLEKVIVGGEYLHSWFREKLEKTFNVKVYNGFGMSEFGAIGIEEISGSNKFKLVSNLIYEVVDIDGNSSFEGEGDLVITDPFNQSTYLVRYITGDYVKLEKGYFTFIKRKGDLIKLFGDLYSKQELINNVGNIVNCPFLFVIKKDVNYEDKLYLFLNEKNNEFELNNYFKKMDLKVKISHEQIKLDGKNVYFKDLR